MSSVASSSRHPPLPPNSAPADRPAAPLPSGRTKAGCLVCRSRRIKCDQTKPECERCVRYMAECVWPEKKRFDPIANERALARRHPEQNQNQGQNQGQKRGRRRSSEQSGRTDAREDEDRDRVGGRSGSGSRSRASASKGFESVSGFTKGFGAASTVNEHVGSHREFDVYGQGQRNDHDPSLQQPDNLASSSNQRKLSTQSHLSPFTHSPPSHIEDPHIPNPSHAQPYPPTQISSSRRPSTILDPFHPNIKSDITPADLISLPHSNSNPRKKKSADVTLMDQWFTAPMVAPSFLRHVVDNEEDLELLHHCLTYSLTIIVMHEAHNPWKSEIAPMFLIPAEREQREQQTRDDMGGSEDRGEGASGANHGGGPASHASLPSAAGSLAHPSFIGDQPITSWDHIPISTPASVPDQSTSLGWQPHPNMFSSSNNEMDAHDIPPITTWLDFGPLLEADEYPPEFWNVSSGFGVEVMGSGMGSGSGFGGMPSAMEQAVPPPPFGMHSLGPGTSGAVSHMDSGMRAIGASSPVKTPATMRSRIPLGTLALKEAMLYLGAGHLSYLRLISPDPDDRSSPSPASTSLRLKALDHRENAIRHLRSAKFDAFELRADAFLAACATLISGDVLMAESAWREVLRLVHLAIESRGGVRQILFDERDNFKASMAQRCVVEQLASIDTFAAWSCGQAPMMLTPSSSWWEMCEEMPEAGNNELDSCQALTGMHRDVIRLVAMLATAKASTVMHPGTQHELAGSLQRCRLRIDTLPLPSRVRLGSLVGWYACDLFYKRELCRYPLDHPDVIGHALTILDLCENATSGKMIYLNWVLLVSASVMRDHEGRRRIRRLLVQFRPHCAYDIEAEQTIIDEMWRRMDSGADDESCSWSEVMVDLGKHVIVV